MNYQKRVFLNKKEGMAAIEATMKSHESTSGDSFDANVCVTDCNRQISLEFSVWRDDISVEDRLEKINTIIDVFTELRDNIVEFCEDAIFEPYELEDEK